MLIYLCVFVIKAVLVLIFVWFFMSDCFQMFVSFFMYLFVSIYFVLLFVAGVVTFVFHKIRIIFSSSFSSKRSFF